MVDKVLGLKEGLHGACGTARQREDLNQRADAAR